MINYKEEGRSPIKMDLNAITRQDLDLREVISGLLWTR